MSEDENDAQHAGHNRAVAAVHFVEKSGQKEVSFVLRRLVSTSSSSPNSTTATATATAATAPSTATTANANDFSCKVEEKLRWEFAWCTMLDDNNFSLLAALINRHAPAACYITENIMQAASSSASRSAKKLLAALNTCEVVAKPSSHFKFESHKTSLLSLVGKVNLSFLEGLDRAPVAAGCLGCLFRHEVAQTMSTQERAGSHRVVALDITNHMKLDHAAVAALHLFPASRHEDRFHSLFGTLNVCKTKKIGERLLERWIRQPLLEVDDIVARQKLVQVRCLVCTRCVK